MILFSSYKMQRIFELIDSFNKLTQHEIHGDFSLFTDMFYLLVVDDIGEQLEQ